MKHISTVSFLPVITHGSKEDAWRRAIIINFGMKENRTIDDKHSQEESWVEFIASDEDIAFLITKLQSVLDKTRATYNKPIEEVQP